MNTKAKQEKWVIKLDSVGMHHGIGPEGKPFVAKTCGSTSNSYDTATIIVRACNAYDDLVAALSLAELAMNRSAGTGAVYPGELKELLPKIRAALAKTDTWESLGRDIVEIEPDQSGA